MIRLFIKEFCNAVGTISAGKHTRKSYALIVGIDNRERMVANFIITRKALPEGARPGDKIEFISK